jgi:hypothetical protein
MEQCHSCGATLTETMTWCGQCYAPRGRAAMAAPPPAVAAAGTAEPAVTQSLMTRPHTAIPVLPPTVRRSRWRKTQTTFGPIGRVFWTVALVVPFPLFIVAGVIGDFFAFGVAVIWAAAIMPAGLRHVWRAGQVLDD